MKFMKPVPWIRTCANQALLSPLVETWQSVQVRVSLVRTVCGTNCLLLVVTPVTIGILRTDKNGAGRTHGRYSMAGNRTVYSQHVDVVTQDLKAVGGPVAGDNAFVVQHGHFSVGRHLQVTAEAGRNPC